MKTTLDIEDSLLARAKAVAAQRRTTLRAVVEHALRRDLAPAGLEGLDPDKFEVGPNGILNLKRTDNPPDHELYRLLAAGDLDAVETYLDSRGHQNS